MTARGCAIAEGGSVTNRLQRVARKLIGAGYFFRGSSCGLTYTTSNGPVPLICTIVSPTTVAKCGIPAGRWTKLPAGKAFASGSSFSPDPTANPPAMTVTNSSLECRCGGIANPAGNLRRSTKGPSLAGLPSRTAACAPGGREGGAGPHWTASPDTTV